MIEDAYNFVGLCSGAGGLDLGFELAGFRHRTSMDIEPFAVKTITRNRPNWNVEEADLREYEISSVTNTDVLLAGVPCQGFSLGGNRDNADPRNQLYKHVVRISKAVRPRVVVIENVLNLRTMNCPNTGRPFSQQIGEELEKIGYEVFFDVFRVSLHGVPQTRRRFVFVAFDGCAPPGYHLPTPDPDETPIREHLFDLGNDGGKPPDLPNHNPQWGFKSAVHQEVHIDYDSDSIVVPVRFSRTASDGNPIRSFDQPFPAIDTATVWGWAQGNVQAKRVPKDRKNGKHIRNPNARVDLWRVTAARLRSFTHREYARLQTFPDDWEFFGNNKRDIHKQIGNAVPVEFARRLGNNISTALNCLDQQEAYPDSRAQGDLFALA